MSSVPRGRALVLPHEGRSSLCLRNLEVEHDDQIEGLVGLPLSDIGSDPLDGDVIRGRESCGLVETDLGEVDAGGVPSLGGEPDRVAPLTTSQIQRPARRQALDLRWKERLGSVFQTNSAVA